MTTAGPAGGRGATALFPIDPGDLERARGHLERRAEATGMLSVAFRTVDTPLGVLLLAATGRGLVRVAFESEGFDAVLDGLAAGISPRILRAPARLDETVRQLDEYFAGDRTTFDVPLDRSLSSGFRRDVQRHLTDIGYGHTATYKEVAAALGNPRAVRAVGSACATNPLPVVVPCHRVLRSDGGLGGYRGGLGAKSALLALEGAA